MMVFIHNRELLVKLNSLGMLIDMLRGLVMVGDASQWFARNQVVAKPAVTIMTNDGSWWLLAVHHGS